MRPEVSNAERTEEINPLSAEANCSDGRAKEENTVHADLRASDYIPGEITAQLARAPVDEDTKGN